MAEQLRCPDTCRIVSQNDGLRVVSGGPVTGLRHLGASGFAPDEPSRTPEHSSAGQASEEEHPGRKKLSAGGSQSGDLQIFS